MSGSTWFCGCGQPTCKNTFIDMGRVAEEHITYVEFQTGDDDGTRSVFSVPVVLLAEMLDQPEEQRQLDFGGKYGWIYIDCDNGDFDLETPDGYTSLLVDEEFIKMLKQEVFNG